MGRFKQILLSITLLIFLSPLIEENFHLINLSQLKGSFTKADKVELTLNSWFDHDFQKNYEPYINDHFGLRNFFIRIHNQVEFSLFNQIKVQQAVIGKNNYLYGEGYIKAYIGDDFVGDSIVSEKVEELESISYNLKKKGKALIVILAPGKASYMPENFPEKYDSAEIKRSNYLAYSQKLKQSNVTVMDCNAWFLSLKNTTKYPLYPKTGVHWSVFGEVMVIDSLSKLIEKKLSVNLPRLIIHKIDTSTKMEGTDEDIEESMNLLFDIPDLKMGYPRYEFEPDAKTDQVKALTIGDSYFSRIQEITDEELFDQGEFWYYFKSVNRPNSIGIQVSDLDIEKEILDKDVIILINTEANLSDFGHGAINIIGRTLEESGSFNYKQKVEELIKEMKRNQEWLDQLKKKAADYGMTLEETMVLDAEHLLKNNSF